MAAVAPRICLRIGVPFIGGRPVRDARGGVTQGSPRAGVRHIRDHHALKVRYYVSIPDRSVAHDALATESAVAPRMAAVAPRIWLRIGVPFIGGPGREALGGDSRLVGPGG